ncbi:MAG TPA: HEAT repeat domain-containing protein [Pseudolysinimonas sp.]|nr:HEAT repeat domain-containing protein [Pseudolysinimonas sp.]
MDELGLAQRAWLKAAVEATPKGGDRAFPWPDSVARPQTWAGTEGGFAKYVWALGLLRLLEVGGESPASVAAAVETWKKREKSFANQLVVNWIGAKSGTAGAIGQLDVRDLVAAAVDRLVDPATAAALTRAHPYGSFAEIAARYYDARRTNDGPSGRDALVERARAAVDREVRSLYSNDPSHYVDRPGAQEAWADFLVSDRRAFALLGESGRGKTNTMVRFIRDLPPTHIGLLYNGVDVKESLLVQVLSDLLGKVPRNREAALHDLVRELDGNLVIAVDALNSYRHDVASLQRELDLLTDLGDQARLRIAVSCTLNDWPRWHLTNGDLTKFARSLYAVDPDGSGRAEGVVLGDFTDSELDQAWIKYEIPGHVELTEQLRKLVKIPEAMRLVATTPASAGQSAASLPRLIDAFVDEQCRSDRSEALRVIALLAECMLDAGTTVLRQTPSGLRGDEKVLGLLDRMSIITRRGGRLSFRSDVLADHYIGNVVYERVLLVDDAAERIGDLRLNRLENLPGAIDAAFGFAEEEAAGPAVHSRLVACVEAVAAWPDSRWLGVAGVAVGRRPSLFPRLIVSMCSEESYVIRETAAKALSRFEELVVEARGSKDWRTRETAALSHKHSECDGNRCRGLWVLASDVHWRVRRAVGYALARKWATCGGHLRESIRDAMSNPEPAWRQCHALMIALLHEPASGGGVASGDDVSDFLGRCARSPNRQLRWLAAYYLPRYPVRVLEELDRVFSVDEDPWIRATYATSLVEIAMNEQATLELVLPQLASLSADPDPAVRIRVARAMGARRGELAFAEQLNSLRADAVQQVRAAARYGIERSTFEPKVDFIAERIAYQDTDPIRLGEETPGDVAEVSRFITDRLAIRFVDDPYVHRFETMRGLFSAAIQRLTDDVGELSRFLDRMIDDPDEGVRWALVLCLKRPELRLQSALFVDCLNKLALDTHMWVRREVADSILLLVADRRLDIGSAWNLIIRMQRDPAMSEPDFFEEVAPFLEPVVAEIRKPRGPGGRA